MERTCPKCGGNVIIPGEISGGGGLIFTPDGSQRHIPLTTARITAFVCGQCAEVFDLQMTVKTDDSQPAQQSAPAQEPVPEINASHDEDEDDDYTFTGQFSIWTEDKIDVDIVLDEDAGNPDEAMRSVAPFISQKLSWLQQSRTLVAESLVAEGLIQLAEEWTRTGERVKREEQECYLVEGGDKVFLPISKEDFMNSLILDSATLDFSAGAEDMEIQLFLRCNPDYFACHAIVVDIDAAGNVLGANIAG